MNDRSGYPSGLTAQEFEVLIHLYWSPLDTPEMGDPGSDVYRSIKGLQGARLVQLATEQVTMRTYELTERGACLVRCILNLPLPESTWMMPSVSRTDVETYLANGGAPTGRQL